MVRPADMVVFCSAADCQWQRSGGWCDCPDKKTFDIARGSSCFNFEVLIDWDEVAEYDDYASTFPWRREGGV